MTTQTGNPAFPANDLRLSDEREKRALPGQTDAPRGKQAGPGEPHRILIVEDDWFIATDMQRTLSDAGYDIIGTAADDSEAFNLVSENRPDLVLVDIRLARGSDGTVLARSLREQFDLPCVFVTAHYDAETREVGDRAQPRGWLTKPFTPAQLLAAVRAALADLH